MPLRTLFMIALVLVALQSCQKDRWIDNEQAADELANALVSNSGGLASETQQKTLYLQNEGNNLPCDQPITVTRNFNLTSGQRTANVTYNWVITKNCSTDPATISWTSTYSGSYGAPKGFRKHLWNTIMDGHRHRG